MRITEKSAIIPYQRNLEEIQTRRFKENLRLSTGKQIQSISESPDKLVQVKELTTHIEKNNAHISNLEEVLKELSQVDDRMQGIADKFQQIRQLAVDASAVGNTNALYALGTYVKGLLEDIVNDANTDFNGKFLFSGTKTNSASLDQIVPGQNDMPFELLSDSPSADNPSGLRVIFKGNNKDRVINKDSNSEEIINSTASEIFGGSGTEVFKPIIDLVNLLTYNQDGTKRSQGDLLSRDEMARLNEYQKKIMDVYEHLDTVTARNGARLNRLEAVRDQVNQENTRLKELRSLDADTDVAASTLKLMQEDTALQYTLQTGAKIIPQSLFDFLA